MRQADRLKLTKPVVWRSERDNKTGRRQTVRVADSTDDSGQGADDTERQQHRQRTAGDNTDRRLTTHKHTYHIMSSHCMAIRVPQ